MCARLDWFLQSRVFWYLKKGRKRVHSLGVGSDPFSGRKKSRDGVEWWRIDMKKGPFAPTTCILFVVFHVLKMILRLIKLQLKFMSSITLRVIYTKTYFH